MKFYRLSEVPLLMITYQFIKTFLDDKMSIFEDSRAFNILNTDAYFNKVQMRDKIRQIFYKYPDCASSKKKKKKKMKEKKKERLYDVLHVQLYIQSTLVISNSKGLSETLRDIRTSKYQIFRIEEKVIRTTTFNKFMHIILLLKLEIYQKYCEKEEKLLLR